MSAHPANSIFRRISSWHFSRFSLVGLFNTAFGYFIIFLLYYLGAPEGIASFTGYAAGLVLSFFLSKHFVFAASGHNVFLFARFLTAFFIAFFINLIILKSLMGFDLNFYIAQIIASVGYFIAFFLMSKLWVFKAKKAQS